MVFPSFGLQNKVAIVTGCSSGLGQGMALGLAEAGCHIVAVNTSDPIDTREVVLNLNREFLTIKADLTSLDSIPEIVSQTLEKFGRIDILVNNAGIIRRQDAIAFNEQDWDDVININLKTTFFLSQAVAKQFIAQADGGKIINIASMLSYQGGVRVPSYTASKSGVMGITRLMANEWAKFGINVNVNAIAPGYKATNNTADLQADEDETRLSSSGFQLSDGENLRILRGLVYFWHHKHPITLMVLHLPLTVGG